MKQKSEQFTEALNHIHFTGLSHTGQTAGKLADYFFLIAAQHVDIDFRLGIRNTVGFQMAYFVNHRRIMQQRCRRNSPHIQAYTAQGTVLLDNGYFQALISRGKSCGITAWAATQYHNIILGIR